MVGFFSEPSIDDLDQAPNFKDSNSALDPFDPTSTESSFPDSFLDFDLVKDWLEDTIPEMADMGKIELGAPEKPIELVPDQIPRGCELICDGSKLNDNRSEQIIHGCDPSVDGSGFAMKVEKGEGEKLGNFSSCIELEMGKVSLVGEACNLGLAGGNDVKREIESDEDGSGSSESASESTSSSGATSSSVSSSDDEQEEVEEKKEVKVEAKMSADETGEVEEGEIRDVDEQELVDGTDDYEEDEHAEEDDEDVMLDWSDVDEDGGVATKGPIKSMNELEVLPPVPPVDVTLQPHHQMIPMGVVLSIIGAQLIVEGLEKHNPLTEGSILWITERRAPLGLVDEIFGPVKNPYYKVRYNSDGEVPSGILAGTLISFVAEFANHVLNDKDLYKKGYDASGANDEEVFDEAEFSDDEKEAEYRRMQKMTKRGMNDQNINSKKNNRKKGNGRDGPWRSAQPSPRQPQTSIGQVASNQNQHNFSPAAAFVGQSFVSGTGLVPPFPPTAQTVWTNGMPFQPPQTAIFPNGFPTNGMTWLAQNPYQHQMPLPNRMMFQQQFDPSQRSLPTAILPAEQSNMFVGPTCAQGLVDRNGINQMTFGLGLQGQRIHPSMNMGEQVVLSNESQVEQNCNMQQSVFTPGSVDQQINSVASSGRGRKPYRRGGGRFTGARGWHQS